MNLMYVFKLKNINIFVSEWYNLVKLKIIWYVYWKYNEILEEKLKFDKFLIL